MISPDSRYILPEPLKLVDVEAWELYDLRKAFQLKMDYFNENPWTKDGKQVLVHFVRCLEYWLIELQ